MLDFFKYLTVGEADKNWGIYLNVAGKATIAPQTVYPPSEHPTGYYFTWNKGRVLEEYQLIYITEGNGVFERGQEKYMIKPGSLILIRPKEKHRYRPQTKTGWIENYVGFNGEFANHFCEQSIFANKQPVIHCGIRAELIETYRNINRLIQEERPGFQQIAAGLIIKLLGCTVAFQKQIDFTDKPIEKTIQQARFQMQKNVEKDMDLHQFATQHFIGYSYFRKMFKKYTGVAPHQYYLDLKIRRAKALLLTSNKSIKEISYALNFESIHYFSRLFKNKTGVNPTSFRKKVID